LNLQSFNTSDSSFQNFTVFTKIQAGTKICPATTWKYNLTGPSAGANVNVVMCVKRTLPGSLTVVDTTTVTYGASSTPSLPVSGGTYDITVDTISAVPFDYGHDHYLVCFFTNSQPANPGAAKCNEGYWNTTSPSLTPNSVWSSGYISGDHTGDTTIPNVTGDGTILHNKLIGVT